MNDKITFTITRRKLTEILMGLVALFLTSGAVAAILKYLTPKTVTATSSEVKIASVDEVTTGTAKKFGSCMVQSENCIIRPDYL